MVNKGPYLILNAININAYHKFSTFLRGTSMMVQFMKKKKEVLEVTKSFSYYFICPGGNGDGWNCVRIQNLLSYAG